MLKEGSLGGKKMYVQSFKIHKFDLYPVEISCSFTCMYRNPYFDLET